jgi:DNA-binding transcriptional LysR family regulator
MGHSPDHPPRDKLPPLNALRNFEAVARLGSFAAAAAELHVTHWAVGKQIKSLENWFAVALFERRARGVVLTEEGVALLGDVSSTFERLATAATRLRRDPSVLRIAGTIRVNVPISFALHWLLPRLADFQSQYPEIVVRISTSSRKVRYIGDAFDIGVRIGQEESSGVVSRTLMPDLQLPACSPDVLRQHPIRSAADLRHHTLLHSASTRNAWPSWQRLAQLHAFRPIRDVEFEHAYLQLTAAVEGMGVTLASLPLIERELAAGRLVCPLADPVWRAPDYALVIKADRKGDEAVVAFERWITAMAGLDPALVT